MMPHRRHSTHPRPRILCRGFRYGHSGAGLVEVMLALTIFGLMVTATAGVTLKYAVRMKTVSVGAARSAGLIEYLNRLMSVPFDSLANRAGCTTVTTGSLPNTRCITVSSGTTSKTVTVVLTPTNTGIKPDTIVLTRVKVATSSLVH